MASLFFQGIHVRFAGQSGPMLMQLSLTQKPFADAAGISLHCSLLSSNRSLNAVAIRQSQIGRKTSDWIGWRRSLSGFTNRTRHRQSPHFGHRLASRKPFSSASKNGVCPPRPWRISIAGPDLRSATSARRPDACSCHGPFQNMSDIHSGDARMTVDHV